MDEIDTCIKRFQPVKLVNDQVSITPEQIYWPQRQIDLSFSNSN